MLIMHPLNCELPKILEGLGGYFSSSRICVEICKFICLFFLIELRSPYDENKHKLDTFFYHPRFF